MDEARAQQKSVLVVEDDVSLQARLADVLVRQGYRVMQTGNGADGLRLARQQRPDVVLLDLVLPRKSGLEVLEELKANEDTWPIPVIVMSASARFLLPGERRRAYAVFQKPFPLEELLAAVQGSAVGGRWSAVGESTRAATDH